MSYVIGGLALASIVGEVAGAIISLHKDENDRRKNIALFLIAAAIAFH